MGPVPRKTLWNGEFSVRPASPCSANLLEIAMITSQGKAKIPLSGGAHELRWSRTAVPLVVPVLFRWADCGGRDCLLRAALALAGADIQELLHESP